MFRPYQRTLRVTTILFWLFVSSSAVSDRSDSFIGYSEKAANCEDTLPDCLERSKSNGCCYNAYQLRKQCPSTCNVERCSYHGTLQVRHRGHATEDGTQAYLQLIKSLYVLPKGHFNTVRLARSDDALTLTRMGIGTYLGDTDLGTDEALISAVLFSVSHGWNVIDTASNYRWGRSEVNVGSALSVLLAGNRASDFAKQPASQEDAIIARRRLTNPIGGDLPSELINDMTAAAITAIHQGGDITRDMVFISTKAGFTTPDLVDRLVKDGVMTTEDVVYQMHSMHPEYIKASLELSLERMNLETVDLLYLHNAAEVQLPAVGADEFKVRLLNAFRACEGLRVAGKIRFYGLATWECFRKPPSDPLYLSLDEVVQLAAKAGGTKHGFRYVQLPINAGMPEAWLEPWQSVSGRNMTFMEAAAHMNVGVMTSGPLGEAELLTTLGPHMEYIPELSKFSLVSSKLLQYARSVPGVITTLVGHKTQAHVEANIQLTAHPRLTPAQFKSAHRALTVSRLRAQNSQQQAQ